MGALNQCQGSACGRRSNGWEPLHNDMDSFNRGLLSIVVAGAKTGLDVCVPEHRHQLKFIKSGTFLGDSIKSCVVHSKHFQ